ncbi:hypothetical protein CTAYLR_005878 [Chrysophaeum taylorii]|uniref:Uncharacterized protein n=1 Tax=Chrysophaeum taylorii TaxID=2483200 RepID=A0AAD7UI63_9STRA|nr:hypothetical protein CTAYLR_005878 [Chrysophaeum taylorii]
MEDPRYARYVASCEDLVYNLTGRLVPDGIKLLSLVGRHRDKMRRGPEKLAPLKTKWKDARSYACAFLPGVIDEFRAQLSRDQEESVEVRISFSEDGDGARRSEDEDGMTRTGLEPSLEKDAFMPGEVLMCADGRQEGTLGFVVSVPEEDDDKCYKALFFASDARAGRASVVRIGAIIPTWRVLCAIQHIAAQGSPLVDLVIGPPPPPIANDDRFEARELYPAQRDAVRRAIARRGRRGPQTLLLHGPPGTGKTTTSARIVFELVRRLGGGENKKILVCAPTNVAVENNVSKYIEKHAPPPLDVLWLVGDDKDEAFRATTEPARKAALGRRVDLFVREALKKPDHLLGTSSEEDDEERKNLGVVAALKDERLRAFLERMRSQPWGRNLVKAAEAFFINRAKVIFSTVCGAGRPLLNGLSFEDVVIDEAAQCEEALSLIVLQRRETQRLVLVGDPKQLPATVFSSRCQDAGYASSLMERLDSQGWSPAHSTFLNIQHRMHPEISLWPNHRFYDGCLVDGPCTLEKTTKTSVSSPSSSSSSSSKQQQQQPFVFLHVAQGSETRDEKSLSRQNRSEAAVVAALVKKIFSSTKNSRAPTPTPTPTPEDDDQISTGVVTPYRAQRELIKRELGEDLGGKINVDTVDSFQGQERDVIIVSTVRSNENGDIGFLKDARRMNVALTRAKRQLVVVGNSETLSLRDANWRSLVENARERKCFLHLDETGELQRTKPVRRALRADSIQRFMRAEPSKYFEGLLWTASFCGDFGTQLSTRIGDEDARAKVLEAIHSLLEGHWPRRERRESFHNSRAGRAVHVLHVNQLVGIFWTVELQERGRQEIRFWGVLPLQDSSERMVRRIVRYRESLSDEYARKTERRDSFEISRFKPIEFPP